MNWFNQKLFLENEFKKHSLGNWTATKLCPVQVFLANSSTPAAQEYNNFWPIPQSGSGGSGSVFLSWDQIGSLEMIPLKKVWIPRGGGGGGGGALP